MSYLVPSAPVHAQIEIKKSRFIAQLHPLRCRAEIQTLLQSLRQDHRDARHVCYGFRIGGPDSIVSAGCDDDGEPSGTAGKPIFNVINHSPLGDLGIFVVRYFGGIKLGAGGLVRAYSGAATAVMSQVISHDYQPTQRYHVHLTFALEARVRHLLDELAIEISGASYTHEVCLEIQASRTQSLQLQPSLAALGARFIDPEQND